MYVRFLLLLLISCFFIACETENKAEQTTVSDVDIHDSLFIVTNFNTALTQPHLADSLMHESLLLANQNEILREVYLFNLAKYYIQTGKIMTADSVINNVLSQYSQNDSIYTIAKFYNLKSAVAAYQHQQEKSVVFYQKAIAIFEKHQDYKQLAVIQFNLANTFFSRMDYTSVYKYIKEARTNFKKINDETYAPIANGIMAIASIKLNEEEEGKALAEIVLSESLQKKNPLGEILAHYALGEYDLYKKRFDAALQHFEKAQWLSESYKVPNLNMPIQAALLNTYVNLGKHEDAIKTGNTALAMAQAANNIEIQYNLNRNLSEAYAQAGNTKQAYLHLKNAEAIFKSNTVDNNQEILQKLLIEYETEKKNNVILQQENALGQQRMSIVSLLALAIIGIILFVSYRKNIRQKSKIERRNKALEIAQALTQGEEKERIRLANELHDGIASNLVAIKLQLEAAEAYAQKENNIALVKKTHQEVRKVAHNLMPIDFKQINFENALSQFCADMHNDDTIIHFLESNQNIDLPQNDALILYRCTQELIQNAIKHANAKNITVQVIHNEDAFRINVEDDGIGFNLDHAKEQQMGLFKFKERLQQIGADFELDSRLGYGTTIFIYYKLQ